MTGKNIQREQIKDSGKTPVYGLSFIPTLEPDISDFDSDIRDINLWKTDNHDNSEAVLDFIREYAKGDIMEIGVSLYSPEKSFTHIILNQKKNLDYYFGIDVEDRKFIENKSKNIHFRQINSLNKDKVINEINKINIQKFDALIIDGHHSVRNCINDIQYSELVKVGGYIIIHDTNAFPGPICLIEAMDKTMFQINEPLLNVKDFGIAICKKIKE